jgi:hypothetical protein
MNDKRDFDRAVDRWLDEGSDATPPEVINAVLLAVRITPQERDFRISWRNSPMKRLGYAVAAVAALAVSVTAFSALSPRFGIGSGPTPTATIQQTPDASPSPSTSPRPSPSPGFSRFNSTIHGISIDYPSDWQVRPATEPWNHDAFTFDAPGVDVIFDPTHQDDLYFSLASEPLGGQSAEDWMGLWASAKVCETGGNFGTFTLDGAKANIRGCDGFANGFEDHVVQVATATRGYVIYLHVGGDPILQATYTEDWFDAALETVELR